MEQETLAQKVYKLETWMKDFKTTQPIAGDSLILYKYEITWPADLIEVTYILFTSQSAQPTIVEFNDGYTSLQHIQYRGPYGNFYVVYPPDFVPVTRTTGVYSTQPGVLRAVKRLPWV